MEKALKDMRVEEFAKYVESIPDWRLDEIIASLQRRRDTIAARNIASRAAVMQPYAAGQPA